MAKRGGQKGNKNAQIHGLYSDLFSEGDLARIAELAERPPEDLVAEIAVLRFAFQKWAAHGLAKGVDPLVAADVISQAGVRLAQVLKAQRVLEGRGSDSLAAAMAVAIQEIGEELGLADAAG